jgi:hypothetical protein
MAKPAILWWTASSPPTLIPTAVQRSMRLHRLLHLLKGWDSMSHGTSWLDETHFRIRLSVNLEKRNGG